MDQVNHFDISLLAKFALVKESIIKGGTNNALKLKPCLTHLLTKFLKIRGRRNHTCPPDPLWVGRPSLQLLSADERLPFISSTPRVLNKYG